MCLVIVTSIYHRHYFPVTINIQKDENGTLSFVFYLKKKRSDLSRTVSEEGRGFCLVVEPHDTFLFGMREELII